MTKLFSKEKDIFLKIVNSVLVLWLMVAIVIAFGVGIQLINRNSVGTYDSYVREYYNIEDMNKLKETMSSEEFNELDRSYREAYSSEKKYQESFNRQNVNNELISISNVLIVSVFLFLLNSKSKK